MPNLLKLSFHQIFKKIPLFLIGPHDIILFIKSVINKLL